MKKHSFLLNIMLSLLLFHNNYAQIAPATTISNITINNQNVQYANCGGIYAPDVSTSPVKVTGTSQVDFIAGTEIDLKPGFSVQSLAYPGQFHAIINRSPFDVVFFQPASARPQVPKYEKLELGFRLPANIEQLVTNYFSNNNTGINPYDYNKINIEATFTKGILTRKSYGFYYRDFHISGESWVADPTTYDWRVRFAPDDIGAWTCSINVSFNDATLQPLFVGNIQFDCIANPDPEEKGYIEKESSQFLTYSGATNETFFPIGQNLMLPTYSNLQYPDPDNSTLRGQYVSDYTAHRDVVSNLSDNGGNYFRLFLAPYEYDVEWEKLGDYDSKQYSSWEMDKLMDLLYQKNVYMDLTLYDYGQFSVNNGNNFYGWEYPYNHTPAHPNMNSHSPYKDVPGITQVTDVFTTHLADDYVKRKIRYVLARWGYSTHVADFEIMNEIDNSCEYYDIPQSIPDDPNTSIDEHQDPIMTRPYFTDATLQTAIYHWQTDLFAPYLKNTDEKKHLLTTSYSAGPFSYDNTCYDNNIDLTQLHNYSDNTEVNYLNSAPGGVSRVDAISSQTFGTVVRFNKPSIWGEIGMQSYGLDHNSSYTCSDVSFHNDLWATTFMGGYGTGLNWWSGADNTFRQNFIGVKNVLSGFNTISTNYAEEQNHISSDHLGCNQNTGKIEYYALKATDGSSAIGWAHNRNYTIQNLYNVNQMPNCVPLSWNSSYNASGFDEAIILEDMQSFQDYIIDWYETTTGTYAYSSNARSGDYCILHPSRLEIPAPGFDNNTPDLAFKVRVDNSRKYTINNVNNAADSISTLSIFPNPGNGLYTIQCEKPVQNVTLEIVDILGKCVFSKQYEELYNIQIDISSLNSGIYFAHIKNKAGFNEIHKIIKN